MMKRSLSRIALQAAAAVAALALAACGAQPYPEPSEAPPPPPPPTALLGEPAPLPPPPPPSTPVYQSPPAYQPSGPVIIAMAPIPNPPSGRRAASRSRTTSPVRTAPGYRYVAPARPRVAAARPAPYKSGAVPARPTTVAKAPAAKAPAAKLAPKAAPKGLAKVAPPKAAPKALGAAPALKAPAGNAQVPATPLGDRATRLAALEMALSEAVSKDAKLAVPGAFTANEPADVTLTLPAEFAQTLRDAAAENQLSDAAAAVNLTAVLSGDGYAVTPDATQSQPLVAGQPTEFHWSVTAQPDAKGLHADMGADLIGAGSDMLNLGTVQSSGMGFKLTPRVLGAGILVLIAILVVAGLARGRSSPSRSSSARRNARQARRDPPRPVSLSENEL